MYQLYSNAIIVKTNLNSLLNDKYLYYKHNNDKELIFISFENEERTEGVISRVENIHMLPADENRIASSAVHFLAKDNYIMFFTSSVSYVYKAMIALEGLYSTFVFEIVKHPFNYSLSDSSSLESFIKNNLPHNNLNHLEIDNMFGFKLEFTNEEQFHLLNFYTNGLITFEMKNNKKYLEKIFSFITEYYEFYNRAA